MYKFVLVDDDDIICESVSSTIDWEAFRFDPPAVFPSGSEVVEYLQSHQTDVVVTDLHMENASGLELAETIREISPQTLIILYSSSQNFDDALHAIKIGVFDYLLKPATPDQLNEMMRRVLACLDDWPGRPAGKGTSDGWESIISMAQKYINDNLCNNIRLEQLAEYVHMNPTYFSRYFKKHTNQKLIDYITNQRINRAVELMRDPTVKIYNIGYQVGYKNLQHFYKTFKQTTGYTPSEYRRQFYGMSDELSTEDE